MGHAWHVVCIAKASHVDVNRSASFVCIWVMNEKSFELVRQSYDTVGSIVERWSFEFICDAFYGSHTGKGTCEECPDGKSRSERRHSERGAARTGWTMQSRGGEYDRTSVKKRSHVRHVVTREESRQEQRQGPPFSVFPIV